MAAAREDQRPTILVVDDEAGPRDALNVILRPFFNIRSAENAAKALAILNTQPIDLISLDQRLPDRQGIDLLQDIKQAHADVEVIIITGHGSMESAMEGIRHGAAGYLLKPFNVTELISLVNQTLTKKKRLDFIRNVLRSCPRLWGSEEEVSTSWHRLKADYEAMSQPSSGAAVDIPVEGGVIPLLSDILEVTHRQLLNHASRTSVYATVMGAHLNLASEMHRALSLGAFLHDIGKVPSVCCGSGAERADPSAQGAVHTEHPDVGARFIRGIGLPTEVGHIALYHHERWDGQGFPHGLEKEDIPLLARIVSIAHTFDHLTAEIPGQSPITIDQALLSIKEESHTRFDPALAEIFGEVLKNCKASLPLMTDAPSAKISAFAAMPRIIH